MENINHMVNAQLELIFNKDKDFIAIMCKLAFSYYKIKIKTTISINEHECSR